MAHLIPFWVWIGVPGLGFSPGTRIHGFIHSGSLLPAARSLKKTQLKTAPAQDRREREKRVEGRGAREGSRWGLGEEEGAGGGLTPHGVQGPRAALLGRRPHRQNLKSWRCGGGGPLLSSSRSPWRLLCSRVFTCPSSRDLRNGNKELRETSGHVSSVLSGRTP